MASEVFQRRNLVVLGRTGVGKSTVVNQILGKTVFPVSTTRETRTLDKDWEDEERKIKYRIKIIDTVGLNNKVVESKDIMNYITDYYPTKQDPGGVNLILFVIRKGILTKEEKQAFDCIINNCKKEIQDKSALVITGCEGLDNDGKEEVIQELKHGTKTFVEFMRKGIYPVGFPSFDNLPMPTLKVCEDGVKTGTEELRNVVMDSGVMTLNQDIFFRQNVLHGNSNQPRQYRICVLL